ncbi:MAG: hypothetical protein ACP5RP_01620 [Candidatus Micrarchaeia archaeon]
MIKKLVFIGIILIVGAFVTLFISAPSISKSYDSNLLELTHKLAINTTADGISITPISINETGPLNVVIGSNRSVSYFLFNSSAFQKWESSNKTAASAYRSGAIFVFVNQKAAYYPSQSSSYLPQAYANASNNIVSAGTYYFVVDDANASKNSSNVITELVYYIVTPMFSSYISSTSNMLYASSAVFWVLFIIGLGIAIYGLVKKNQQLQPISQEYIDQLYKNVGTYNAKSGVAAAQKSRNKKAKSLKRRRSR